MKGVLTEVLYIQNTEIQDYTIFFMKKYIADFAIAEKKKIGNSYFTTLLKSPEALPEILPGQFVEVEVPDNKNVLLRRPISIHDVDYAAHTITLLVQIVGKGTRTLSQLAEGRTLNLVYPLGNGFSIVGNKPLLVGGGAGIRNTAKKAYVPPYCWAAARRSLFR